MEPAAVVPAGSFNPEDKCIGLIGFKFLFEIHVQTISFRNCITRQSFKVTSLIPVIQKGKAYRFGATVCPVVTGIIAIAPEITTAFFFILNAQPGAPHFVISHREIMIVIFILRCQCPIVAGSVIIHCNIFKIAVGNQVSFSLNLRITWCSLRNFIQNHVVDILIPPVTMCI